MRLKTEKLLNRELGLQRYLFAAFIQLSSILLLQEKSEAQVVSDSTRGTYGFGIKSTYGFLIVHRPVLEILQERHTYGFELSFLRPTNGDKSFHEKFLYPDIGWTIAWFNLGNPNRLGSGIAIYPYVDFPLHLKKDWRFHFRYGMGLGYIEKIFEVKENSKNAAIGSHLNGVMHFDFNIKKEISSRSIIELGAGLTHYSNGSTAIPNLGINLASANLGFIHYFGEKKLISRNKTEVDDRKAELQVFGAAAFKKIYPPLGETYYAGTISITRVGLLGKKSYWGIGADLFYDNSLTERMERADYEDVNKADNFRPGIYGAYEMRLGHVGVLFNIGFYPYTKWKGDGNVYNRIGARYYLNNFYLLMNLKTHYAKADFIEWGAGYSFVKKKNKKSMSN
ncbi:MAG: acyloxyacyl hydrolase [Bacteroidia bacterium]|nr:acyloxyacyl hydrolase [Bacteroidia bacterium]